MSPSISAAGLALFVEGQGGGSPLHSAEPGSYDARGRPWPGITALSGGGGPPDSRSLAAIGLDVCGRQGAEGEGR